MGSFGSSRPATTSWSIAAWRLWLSTLLAAVRAGSTPVFTALHVVRVATILLAAVFPSILHSWTTMKLRFQFPIFIDGSVFPRLLWIILNLGAGYLFRAVHGSGRVMFFCQARTDRHVFFGIISSLDFAAKLAWSFQISVSNPSRAKKRKK